MSPFRPIELNLGFLNLSKRVAVGFGLIAAISIGVSWVDYGVTEELIEARNWVSHTHQVLARLEAVISDIKDVETGQRGYMLYGQEAFLQPYYAGQKAVSQDIRIIRHLTLDNPIQQQRLDMLESLVSQRIALAKILVEQRRRQELEALRQVGQSKTMDNIRWLVGVMKRTEEQLLEQRSQLANTSRKEANYLSLMGLGLNLVILVGLYTLINREMRARQRSDATLRASENKFRSVVESAQDAIISANRTGTIVSWNQGAQVMFGYTAAEATGKSLTMIMPPHYQDRHQKGMERLQQTGIPRLIGKPVELEALRQDGTEFPVELRLSTWEMDKENYYTAIIRDVTQRKEVEAKLQTYAVTLEQRNQELQDAVTQKEQVVTALQASEAQLKDYVDKLADSNEELGRFAYVASHDLKAPLRTIGTRLGFLLKSLGTPSQAVLQQSERITLALTRMEQLLNDLLAYSRIDTQVKELVPLNTQQVIAVVLESLESLMQETKAVVQVQPELPTVLADSTQLGQVFQNLISNGIKFCQGQPEITISATCQARECTFCVADNGIGISARYQQRIFEVFQRLHGQSEYEGSGIGLSIVKKLIQRHEGRIWVESELGQGSKFFFTLKEANNAS